MVVSAKNLLNFLLFLFVDFFIGLRKIKKHSKSLLILRLDSIGDYILFRNFLTAISVDDKYKDFRITLCGNVIWKELAEKLDSDVIDEFIWLDRIKFLNSLSYKISFLKTIHSKGFETVINSTYTRELLFGDQIVKSTRAVERIGNSGSPDKIRKVRFFSDRFYTKLFKSSNKSLFEFNRNLEFFELLLNKKLNVVRPEINYSKLPGYNGLPVKYCVVFPGSNDVKRRWNAASYAEICEYLISELGFQVVIPLAERSINLSLFTLFIISSAIYFSPAAKGITTCNPNSDIKYSQISAYLAALQRLFTSFEPGKTTQYFTGNPLYPGNFE